MRFAVAWLSTVVLVCGCGADAIPASPTALSVPSSISWGNDSGFTSGGWSPWYWAGWQAGIGERIALDSTAESAVEADEVCVSNLRTGWDARASCKRFVISVSVPGQLDAFLRWDPNAPGYDLTLSGDVVIVAPDGRFAESGWQHTEEQLQVLVQPGEYGAVVMSYVPARLPFQLRLAFRPK